MGFFQAKGHHSGEDTSSAVGWQDRYARNDCCGQDCPPRNSHFQRENYCSSHEASVFDCSYNTARFVRATYCFIIYFVKVMPKAYTYCGDILAIFVFRYVFEFDCHDTSLIRTPL